MSALLSQLQLKREAFHLAIDANFAGDKITAITGPSGSGKTTLLRCLAGLERPQRGYIQLGDSIWYDNGNKVDVPTHQRGIAYIFQEGALFSHLSVEKNLAFGFQRLHAEQRNIQWNTIIKTFSLAPLLKRSVTNLSGGERQRVAIARALLSSPRLLLMDEPVSAIDDESKHIILESIKNIHAQFSLPVIYVSHALDELAYIADDLLYLQQGRVLVHDSLNSALTHNDLPFRMHGDAFTVINAQVAEYDEHFHLATLSLENNLTLQVPSKTLQAGTQVKLQIHARDVSLTLNKPSDSSILNILPAQITQIEDIPASTGHALITLNAGGQIFYARITQKSVHHLALEYGTELFMQIKSIAITR